MKPFVLIAEDEESLVELLSYNLRAEGFRVDHVLDGGEVMGRLDEELPDLLLLDWMLPNLSGIEICRQIRRKSELRNLPVVMLTARGAEDDRIRGLDAGADDYVPKPFSTNELMARVRAVLRRTRPILAEQRIVRGVVELDLDTHKVTRNGTSIHLGPTEFRLLQHFMEHAGRVQSRTQLLDAVWGRDSEVEERTVDVHIRRLRKAMNVGNAPDIIRTVRSAGYAFEAPAA
ncbi:MAG: phosphate regulon transcriptional regulator PhoB [Minwuia sp.]|uniref:phosphate regulon transcriptional regulator PhoB n=1 Tax=Minwuia sp. TaxID=2493630 RepID=UPI003A8C0736